MNKILALLFRSKFWLFAYFLVSLPKLAVLQKFFDLVLFHMHLVLWRIWSESLKKNKWNTQSTTRFAEMFDSALF